MQKIKRLLAVILTALMLISSIPLTSFATTGDEVPENENPVYVEDLQIYDLQAATYNPSTGLYNIPSFNYTVFFSDDSSITKSSTEVDENLVVTHNQKTSPWFAGSQSNYIYISYMGYEVQSQVTVVNDYFSYYNTNGGVVIYGISSELTGAVTLPSTLGGQPVVSLSGMGENITELTIPASVTDISTYYLTSSYYAPNLKTINVSSKNPNYSSYDGVLYNKAKTEVLSIPFARTKSVTLHKSVKKIETSNLPESITVKIDPDSKYFYYKGGVIYNKGATRVVYANKNISGSYTMPSTVKSIDYGAFSECNNLTSVKMSNSVTTITYDAFYSCAALKSVTLPNKLKSIKSGAFSGCKSLSSIKLPSTLKTIGYSAFASTKLNSVTIPNGVTSVGENAFYGCTSLTKATIGSGIKSIEYGIFSNCTSLKSITVPNSIKSIDGYAFYNTAYYNTASNWKNKVLYIGNYLIGAKENISGSYTIKSGTKAIASYAFSNCSKLTSVKIPNSIKCIGSNAFYGCSSLKSVNIPNGITSIKNSTFDYCTSLKSITIPNSVTSIENSAFFGCEGLTKITIGNGVKSIGDCTFYGCKNLKSIAIPNSVTSIVYYAFSDCTSLKNVTLPNSVKKIYSGVFYNCTSLKNVYYKGSKANKAKISIGTSNDSLIKATWYYNSCIGSKSHKYKTTVVTKATLKKNGSTVKKCTVCGKIISKSTTKYAKSFKLSTTSYTYNGKVKTPNVVVKDSAGKTLKKNTDYTVIYAKGRKNIGTYKVTIKMKGKYSGTKTLTFKINPVSTKVSKLTAGKKSITVNISKKSTQVSGYQVQYSTSKKFTSAKTKIISSYKTTKYTLKSLSAKKTYYVRVRTYKTVSGKKYYSGWSTYKHSKTQ